jgi:hypothetical protein
LVQAGRNSVGLLVVILYFYFFIGLQFRAGQTTMPCLHKALLVGSHKTDTLRLIIIFFSGLFLTNCSTTKQTSKVWNERRFNVFDTKDTINLQVTYFVKNSAYCFTEAIPYALLIGQTDNSASSNIPHTITVLAWCDNNNYTVGQKLKVVPLEDPTTKTDLSPIYVVKDTIINNQIGRWLVGSEFPAIWGKVL